MQIYSITYSSKSKDFSVYMNHIIAENSKHIIACLYSYSLLKHINKKIADGGGKNYFDIYTNPSIKCFKLSHITLLLLLDACWVKSMLT